MLHLAYNLSRTAIQQIFLAAVYFQTFPISSIFPSSSIDNIVFLEIAAQNLSHCGVGVGVGTEQNGILFLKGYGYEKFPDQTFDPKLTMVRWASISKSLATVVSANLKNEHPNEFNFDGDVMRYMNPQLFTTPSSYIACENNETGNLLILPPFDDVSCADVPSHSPVIKKLANDKILTLRNLLAHRGGIQHYNNGGSGNWPRGEWISPVPSVDYRNDPTINNGSEFAVKYLHGLPLVSIPEVEFHYSTFGYVLAGAALEAVATKISGTYVNISSLVSLYISKPYRLTTLRLDHEWDNISHRAVGYDHEYIPVSSTDTSYKGFGGGFISSTQDAILYCLGLAKERYHLMTKINGTQATSRKKMGLERFWHIKSFVGSFDATNSSNWHPEEMMESETKMTVDGYGFGFMARWLISKPGFKSPSKLLRVWHTGSQEKARTIFSISYPQHKPEISNGLCIVILSNCESANVAKIEMQVEKVVSNWIKL
ncbi:hypothetical protein HK096_003715 [Nowakowskiella sp. JEL0078]|nr:hypothetical protein HK096_003715 [Nowakowskiella sp. JEL0078]